MEIIIIFRCIHEIYFKVKFSKKKKKKKKKQKKCLYTLTFLPKYFQLSTFFLRINWNVSEFREILKYLIFFYYGTLMSRVVANYLGDQGSIPGRVIPKTEEMVLDAALLSTQHYKVRIKGKVEQSKEWNSTLPYITVL